MDKEGTPSIRVGKANILYYIIRILFIDHIRLQKDNQEIYSTNHIMVEKVAYMVVNKRSLSTQIVLGGKGVNGSLLSNPIFRIDQNLGDSQMAISNHLSSLQSMYNTFSTSSTFLSSWFSTRN